MIIVLPFLWMLGTSFKPESDVFGYPLRLQPTHPTLANYVGIWSAASFPAAGSQFSRVRRRCNRIVGLLRLARRLRSRPVALSRPDGRLLPVLATLMVPYQVTLVPVFQLLFKLHWLNTYQGLIVPRATSAFGIFLLRQFFITVPRELDEAARADGASEWYIYSRIMLPSGQTCARHPRRFLLHEQLERLPLAAGGDLDH